MSETEIAKLAQENKQLKRRLRLLRAYNEMYGDDPGVQMLLRDDLFDAERTSKHAEASHDIMYVEDAHVLGVLNGAKG